METTEAKRLLILEHERWFARELARRVMDAPRLSVWMVLIPIFFVYFFYRYQRVIEGRKEFARDYLMSRERALEAAAGEVDQGRRPDPEALAGLSDVPEEARPLQAELTAVMVGHYGGLLRAGGGDFPCLVRSAYREKANLLMFYSRLNQAERKVNAALLPGLERELEGVSSTISTMEAESEALRREVAEEVFKPGGAGTAEGRK